MPSNVFLYQLPDKPAPLNQGDKFLIEDVDASETKTVCLSALGSSVFSTGTNFRIKDGQYLQLKEIGPAAGANFGKFKTIVMYNGTLALSGAYES